MLIDCPNSPDAHFVAKARAGDREAFEQLVQRHLGNVWTIAFARLADRHAADDLAQEVLLVAWLHLDSLTDPDRFGAWVAQIARNRANDWLRARRRSSKLVAMVPIVELIGAAAETSEPDMDREEEYQLVRDALFALPPNQREMILLKYAQGQNQAQIAEQLGVHPATIGRQLDRALAALQEGLSPVIEQSLRQLRPSRRAAARVASISAATGMMTSSARAALIEASGAAPPTVVTTGTGASSAMLLNTLKVGVGTMGSIKTAGAAAAIAVGLGLAGFVAYEQRSTPSSPAPTTAASVSVSANPFQALPDQLKAILAARYECFPLDVEKLIAEMTAEGANQLDPDHKIGSQYFAAAVDSQGQGWIGFQRDVVGNGSGRAELGTFNPPKVMGVVTEAGEVLPVQMVRAGGTYMAVAQFEEPWPAGEHRKLILLSCVGPIQPDGQGAYDAAFDNSPGVEKIQQIIGITTPGWRLLSSVTPPALSKDVRGYQIHLWQEHLQKTGRLAVSAKVARAAP